MELTRLDQVPSGWFQERILDRSPASTRAIDVVSRTSLIAAKGGAYPVRVIQWPLGDFHSYLELLQGQGPQVLLRR